MTLCLLGTICATVSCGKVSAPVPYPNSDYPHSYPRK